MTRDELLNSIVTDLGANYIETDNALIGALLDEAINDALIVSNRIRLIREDNDSDKEKQITLLSSHIRKAVKSTFLQRGSEDVGSQSISGLSSVFQDALEVMAKDIVRSGKRILM